MKRIIVKWYSVNPKKEGFGYSEEVRVIESSHPSFSKGTRFDFGFFSIATDEGYTIISLPID